MPLVAASERGPAQTRLLREPGVVGPAAGGRREDEGHWKGPPQKVKVL